MNVVTGNGTVQLHAEADAVPTLQTEWDVTRSVWLRWPYRSEIWPQHALGEALQPEEFTPVQQDMLALLNVLASNAVPVDLQVAACANEQVVTVITQLQQQHQGWQCNLHVLDYADIWLRDCAPFVLRTATPTTWHFDFDGWGGIDDQFQHDLAARDWLSKYLELRIEKAAMVLEGGALHHDGEGTALACSGSILFRPGNDGVTAAELRQQLQQSFAIQQVHMLPGKLAADETGGHIDNMAAFLAPTKVVVAYTDDASHPDYATCRRVLDYLEHARDAKGRAFTVYKLPLPRAPRLSAGEAITIAQRPGVRRRIAGMPLMASYVNFLRINCELPTNVSASADPAVNFAATPKTRKLIVMPEFGLPSDEVARNLMAQWLHDYQVISVPARALLVGGGGWHCASFCY